VYLHQALLPGAVPSAHRLAQFVDRWAELIDLPSLPDNNGDQSGVLDIGLVRREASKLLADPPWQRITRMGIRYELARDEPVIAVIC
jgi:hypothetical protein